MRYVIDFIGDAVTELRHRWYRARAEDWLLMAAILLVAVAAIVIGNYIGIVRHG